MFPADVKIVDTARKTGHPVTSHLPSWANDISKIELRLNASKHNAPHNVQQHSLAIMGNYRFIHPEQKKLIVIMSATLSPSQISKHTGISKRTIYRVLEKWRQFGVVTLGTGAVGRPRELTHYDIDVRNHYFAFCFTLT